MEINVNDENLKKLKSCMADYNKSYSIQFFNDGLESIVIYISSKDQTLGQLLSFLVDEEDNIVLGLKCNQQNTYIDLFQIGTSKGVLLIQNEGPSLMLNKFLTSHTFYMKGISCGVQKLTKYLGNNNFSFID